MFDINEVPYAEWLEKSLQAIVPLKPVSLCFAATMPDGEVYTGYYNADATDKAVIAHNIQSEEEPPKLPRDEEHLRGRGEKGMGHAAVQPEAERAAGTGPPPDPRPCTAHSGPQAQRASIPRRGAERSGER